MVKTQNIDTKLLTKVIKESGLRTAFIVDKLGISRQAYYSKKNGKTAFRQSEIYVLCDLLNLNHEASKKIFFPEMLG